ncbi:hypothetical protein [Hoyosella subflava]|uniref:hypothetical protein n=1 Tax=Hoyosella subflava TaxID=639313 RepID=UPI001ED93585|nr:hypothetical protein [Hoyosella subflava]
MYRTGSPYSPVSFNTSGIPPLADERQAELLSSSQGRFDLVHDPEICPGGEELGGQLYVGMSLAAAVAEGVLRNANIPQSLRVPSIWLAGKSLALISVLSPVRVAVLHGTPSLTRLSLDGSLASSTWRDYAWSRITAARVLLATPGAQGMRYQCRHAPAELASMLIDGRGQPALRLERHGRLDVQGWARDAVVSSLFSDFGLVTT